MGDFWYLIIVIILFIVNIVVIGCIKLGLGCVYVKIFCEMLILCQFSVLMMGFFGIFVSCMFIVIVIDNNFIISVGLK